MREVIGIILLVPQGIVPLAVKWFGGNPSSWTLARQLPESYQTLVCVACVVVGALLLLVRRDPAHKD